MGWEGGGWGREGGGGGEEGLGLLLFIVLF